MTQEIELLALLQQDIAARLRSVCDGMSDADFDQLVCDIAAVKLKYAAEAELSAGLRERLTSALEDRPVPPKEQSPS